ncbi:MAG: ribosome maturation factor RimP [Pseudomonadota bacterium]
MEEKIASIIEPSLTDMGYELVQVRFIEGGRKTLQIMAERLDGKGMNVDDCADISYRVSALLDVEDPIKVAYHLEISSAGIDRPLVKISDFEKFVGYELKLETKLMVASRKRFKGRIKAVVGQDIIITTIEGAEVTIPFDMVRSSKLLLTDELLNKHANNNQN